MPFAFRSFAAALGALSLAPVAIAQQSIDDLVGEYQLVSSNTAPRSNWGYTKGRLSIQKLDERHVVILLACEWKREPKAVCRDHYFAQYRDGGIYLQDMNTDWMRMYFDPKARAFTIVSRGFDAKESVRRDLFTPTAEPLTDAALVRRMKTETGLAHGKENRRVFGHYSKWDYRNHRIEFQHQQRTDAQ